MYTSKNTKQTVNAIVSGEVAIKTTQWGDKAVLDFALPDGQKITVWDNLDEDNESILIDLAIGQTVNLYQNDNGNWKVDKKSLLKSNTKKHLTISQSQTPITDITLSITNEDNPVRKQARLLRDCVDAILLEFHGVGLSDDIIQKYATTLYISINKAN